MNIIRAFFNATTGIIAFFFILAIGFSEFFLAHPGLISDNARIIGTVAICFIGLGALLEYGKLKSEGKI